MINSSETPLGQKWGYQFFFEGVQKHYRGYLSQIGESVTSLDVFTELRVASVRNCFERGKFKGNSRDSA